MKALATGSTLWNFVRACGLACAALGGAGRAFAQPQDGSWTGTTTQNRVYNFTVKNGGTVINPLQIGFSGCGTGTITFTSNISISGNSFSSSGGFCPSVTTSGTFTSATTASGTLTLSWTPIPGVCPCSGTLNHTWTATKAPPQANLSVTKNDGRTTTSPGSTNVYTITVTNLGPEPLGSLTLIDNPPPTLLNPIFTPSAGAFDPATGSWTGLSLGAGQSVTLTLSATVSPSASGTLSNTATVSPPAGVTDPEPGNNSSTDTDTVVIQADLAVTQTGPGAVTPPSNLTYRITVTNNGPSDAASVMVTDPTPSGLTFVSNTGFCIVPFPCSLGTIPAGQSRTIDTTFNVADGYAGPNPISNAAGATTSTTDPIGGNNSATATTQVVPPGAASDLFTITPCRLLDTRDPDDPYGGPALVAGADRTFLAFGRCGIPATARAISINVTVTGPSTGGNLRLYPGGQPLPLVSTLNYSSGQTRGNNAVVPLSLAGEFVIRCAQASGTAHAIVDVNGYFE